MRTEADGGAEIASEFGNISHHGCSPDKSNAQRTAARAAISLSVVCRVRVLFPAEPRQRVYLPVTSRKSRVFLSDSNQEWYDGGRISGKHWCG